MSRSSIRSSLVVLAIAASAGFASAARAGGIVSSLIGGNCGTTAPVFSPWGDSHQYYFTTDGGFESGSTGWTLAGGAKVVSGDEAYQVHGRSDRFSLLVPAGATATSPSICFGLLTPGVRFFAKGSGSVHVKLIAHGLLGVLANLDGGTIGVSGSWTPTKVFATLGSQLDVPLGTKSVQIQLTTTGNVQIDDIYIDPFLSK